MLLTVGTTGKYRNKPQKKKKKKKKKNQLKNTKQKQHDTLSFFFFFADTHSLHSGLVGDFITARTPYLSQKNSNGRKRLKWCREHKDWQYDEWSKVLWSDEVPFSVVKISSLWCGGRRGNPGLIESIRSLR